MPNPSTLHRAAASSFRIIAGAQAVFFAGLSFVAIGIFGLGLLFAAGDASESGTSNREVFGVLAIVLLIVLVPCLLTAAFTAVAVVADRHPRVAGIIAFISEGVAAMLLLWPSLHEWIYDLTATRALSLLELGLCAPGAALAVVLAIRSDGVRAAVPDSRATRVSAPPERRH